MISLISETSKLDNSRKFTKDMLTPEQQQKALADLGLDDLNANVLALYALLQGKNQSMADALFKKWVQDLKDALLISGSDVVVDRTATEQKTVKSTVESLYTEIKELKEGLGTKSEIKEIKDVVGQRIFESGTLVSDSTSLLGRIETLENSVKQLAADVFNSNPSIGDAQSMALYNFTGDKQTVSLTIVDRIKRLIDIHGGTYTPVHSHIKEELVIDFNTAKIEFNFGDISYIFPHNNNKEASHLDQVYTYKYKQSSKVNSLSFYVSKNTLNATSYVSLYINGVEQNKKYQ